MKRAILTVCALVCACAALVAAKQQPNSQTPAQPTGYLLGRVVDAQTKAPIRGVVVSLQIVQPRPGQAGPVDPRALTDDQGRFLIRGIPTGTYQVIANVGGPNNFTPSGFLVTGLGFQAGGYLPGGYGQSRAGGSLLPLEMTDGRRAGDLEIRLWKAGSITGRVTDDAGDPLVGQVVGAIQVSSDGRLLNAPTVRTDDRGIYRIPALGPGRYVVFVPQTLVSMPISTGEGLAAAPDDPLTAQRFSAANAPSPRAGGMRIGSSVVSSIPDPGRFGADVLMTNALSPVAGPAGVSVYPTTFLPSATRLAQATRITLEPGQDRTAADVQVRPIRAGSIAGTLTDDAGPVPNVGLHLMPADLGRDASILETAITATDSRGAFAFPAVPPGEYMIVAWRTGAVPAAGQAAPPPLRIGDMSGAWARQPVTVGVRSVENVTVALRAPLTVTGRVLFEGSADRPAADRLRSAPITIYPAERQFRSAGPSAGGTIDAVTGQFSIRGVAPPGRFLFGLPALPTPWVIQSVVVGGRDVTDVPFEIADTDQTDVTVTFTDKPAVISGSVALAAEGDAVSVFLIPADRARWADARSSARLVRSARAGANGFSMTGVIPGDYRIVAAREADTADWPDETMLARLAAKATPLRVDAGQAARVSLQVADIK